MRDSHDVWERRRDIVAWWAAGWTMGQIAEELAWSNARVSTELHLMRRRGYDLPYRLKPAQIKRMRKSWKQRTREAGRGG